MEKSSIKYQMQFRKIEAIVVEKIEWLLKIGFVSQLNRNTQ